MSDSRAFRTNTPSSIKFMQKYILKPLSPVMRYLFDPTFRPSSAAGIDMVELAVNGAYNNGERGYFTLLKKDDPDPVVLEEETQLKIWEQTARWAKITKENTALKTAL